MAKQPPKQAISPPKHLEKPTKEWFSSVVHDFELEEHQVRLLTLAGEAWDRCQQARAAIATYGLTYVDRFGAPHCRPEVQIERDARLAFARLIRELGLSVTDPDSPRIGD